MGIYRVTMFALLGVSLAGCGFTLELGTSELELMTTEEVVLTATQPGNVTSSSDLVQTRWTSSDEDVVIVIPDAIDPRTATLVAVGGGTATVEVVEGAEPAVCQVTVIPAAPLTITVAPDAFQLIEPRLDEIQLGQEGYSAALDTYAFFIDTGASDFLVAEAGQRELTFMTPTSFVVSGARYRLTDPVIVVDGVEQTVVFHGDDGEYEEIP